MASARQYDDAQIERWQEDMNPDYAAVYAMSEWAVVSTIRDKCGTAEFNFVQELHQVARRRLERIRELEATVAELEAYKAQVVLAFRESATPMREVVNAPLVDINVKG